MTSNQPRILVWDLENAPIEAYVWDHWDTNVLHTIEDSYLLCVAYQWLGTGETLWIRKAKGKANDRELVLQIWSLLDEADYVIAHNGDAFDQKKANTRFLKWGLGPPSPYVQIDTLKELRRHFKLASNKLDEAARFLDIGRKTAHAGIRLWLGCMANDEASWSKMEEYNIQDVDLLVDVLEPLRPWIGHPGVAGARVNGQQWTGVGTCTKLGCGSSDLIRRGSYRTKANVYQSYQCKVCGGYSRALLDDNGVLR